LQTLRTRPFFRTRRQRFAAFTLFAPSAPELRTDARSPPAAPLAVVAPSESAARAMIKAETR
jgi:hypothetical protein